MIGEYILRENNLLEKTTTTKRFEYLPQVSQLKKQTSIEKKYQVLDKVY